MLWVLKSTCLNETIIFSTQHIKPWSHIHVGHPLLQCFVKDYTNSKNLNDSFYTQLHSISARQIAGSL